MKLQRVLYAAPLLFVSLCFAVVAVRFKEKQRCAEATRELIQLCKSDYDGNYLQRAATLLRDGANPNARTSHGLPILMEANLALARELLAAGANPDARDTDGYTALMASASRYEENATQYSRLLLQHKANPNLRDPEGNTVLLIASQQCGEVCVCNTEIARMLLARRAQVDVCDSDGNTPLCKAAVLAGSEKSGDSDGVELVRLLLAYGADPQHHNKQGETPISIARQQFLDRPDVDTQVDHVIALLQNAIKQRKRVKSPRT